MRTPWACSEPALASSPTTNLASCMTRLFPAPISLDAAVRPLRAAAPHALPEARQRCGSPATALRAPRTLSVGVWARSVGVDTGSFMIYNTFADSATDSPPVPVAVALLVWRRHRVARFERVSRVRAAILRRTAVSVLIGGVGNQSIPKSALRDGQAKNTATGFRVLNDQLLCWCETGVV